MAIYEITPEELVAIPQTSFAEAGLFERTDLQRLLREQIEILSPDTLVLAEEFADWQDSKRRIDLLGIDRDANLVVIELKRTEDGGHMELQALRYAAMVSTMTFERAVSAFAGHLGIELDDAQARLLEFLRWDGPDEERFAQDVRILLASAEFSKELTTAVLWLNQRDLDIRCIRLRPYRDGSRVLLDVAQVLPLPEAEQYQVRLREKEKRERVSGRALTPDQFFAELATEGADESVARTLTTWAVAQGLHLRWPRGTQRRSVRALLVFGAAADRYGLMILRTSGVLVMPADRLKRKNALSDGKLLSAYQDALVAIPGIELAGERDVRPRFSIACLKDPTAMSQFQSAMGGFVAGIKAWYDERDIKPSPPDDADDDE